MPETNFNRIAVPISIEQTKRLIAPEIYTEAFEKIYIPLSLSKTIQHLSESSHNITYAQSVDIIIKYFYAYICPDTCDETIPLTDITKCISDFMHYHTLNHIPKTTPFDHTSKFQRFNYQLRMLLDIPATAEILTDIINRGKKHLQSYNSGINIDLGTGTGILLLGTYIANQHILPVGVEYNPASARHTQNLLQRAHVPVIIHELDVRDSQGIQNILNGNTIRSVLVELIGNQNQPIGIEPFAPGLLNIIDTIHDPETLDKILLFPEELYIKTIFRTVIPLSHTTSKLLQKACSIPHNFLWTVDSIRLNQEKIKLSEVGNAVRKQLPILQKLLFPERWI